MADMADDQYVSRGEFDALVRQVEVLVGAIRSLEKELAELPRVKTMTVEELYAEQGKQPPVVPLAKDAPGYRGK